MFVFILLTEVVIVKCPF